MHQVPFHLNQKTKASSKRVMPFRVGVLYQLAWCGRRDLPHLLVGAVAGSDCHRQSFTTGPSSPVSIKSKNTGTTLRVIPVFWCGRRDLPHLLVGAVAGSDCHRQSFTPGPSSPVSHKSKNTGITRWALPVFWCGRRDLNPYGVIHTPLKRARLPVPPLPRDQRLV